MNKHLVYPLVLALWGFGAAHVAPGPVRPPVAAKAVVHLSREMQTIHSFGASDCWSAKFIGTWADEARKNQVADLLFSLDTLPGGQPAGIGLSLWRVNIGAGSFEQGEASGIRDEWRREECFRNAAGQYDWTRQAGNQWFLQAARRRGVAYTLGFANSPPVYLTANGKAFSPGGSALNLKPGKLGEFSDFLVEVSRHFDFDYVSPINEPQWDWAAGKDGKAGQEGSPARNADILAVAEALSGRLAAAGSKTKVVLGEAGQLDFLYAKAETGRGNQLAELFSGRAPSLDQLPNVERVLAYHSYFTTCGDTQLVNVRQRVHLAAQAVRRPALWQSEFGVLGDVCGTYNGSPRNTGIDYGLYIAKVVHHDLTIANVTSWQWWLAINPYNYSDGLVYINGPDGRYQDHRQARQAGLVVDSKQLWALGNFSRFIRPGMKRIDVELTSHPDPVARAGSFMLSGYKDEARRQVVLVGVNMARDAVEVDLSGLNVRGNQFTTYTTDGARNLAKATAAADTVRLSPRSVTTLVGYYHDNP